MRPQVLEYEDTCDKAYAGKAPEIEGEFRMLPEAGMAEKAVPVAVYYIEEGIEL